MAGVAALPSAALSEETGSVTAGKRIYLAVGCYECHGRVGEGGAFLGPTPRLAHTALPLDAFTVQLRQPANNMPPYSESVLSEADVANIYAYLQSVPGPQDIKSLPEILTH